MGALLIGLEEARNFLIVTSAELENILTDIRWESAMQIAEKARQYCPVFTGFLRSSIFAQKEGNQVSVGAEARYATFVNFGCFTDKHAKILTQRGHVDFIDVRKGELVMTHKKRWRRILDKHTFELERPLVRSTIRTKGGSQITVTDNHHFFTPYGFKPAEKIMAGDQILSAHNDLPNFHWKNFMEYSPLKGRGEYFNLTCEICGKFFVVPKQDRFHKYCSVICSYTSRLGKKYALGNHFRLTEEQKKAKRGQNNPMFKKDRQYYYSEIGYREDLGHKVKSTWEANYARILKAQGRSYEYEPTSFNLSVGTYTPDFYLPIENKYIEIKGYVTERFLLKLREMIARHPKINIELIDEQKYLTLEKEWKDKIEFWELAKSVSRRGSEIKFSWDIVIEKTKPAVSLYRCYDLTIEEDESYILENLVCHNTSKMPARPFLSRAVFEVMQQSEGQAQDRMANP